MFVHEISFTNDHVRESSLKGWVISKTRGEQSDALKSVMVRIRVKVFLLGFLYLVSVLTVSFYRWIGKEIYQFPVISSLDQGTHQESQTTFNNNYFLLVNSTRSRNHWGGEGWDIGRRLEFDTMTLPELCMLTSPRKLPSIWCSTRWCDMWRLILIPD